MNIGQRVKEARKHRNVTQQELATGVGVTQTTITNLESGRNSGSKHALKIAQFLNINPAWLENGTGPMEFAVHGHTAQYSTTQGTKVIQLEDATHWQEAQAIQRLPTPPGEFTGFFIIAPDDTMENQGLTSIAKGAFVAFNTLKTEPVDEKIYLVASEERPEPIIRKLVKIAGSWELQPANPTYQSERFIEPLRKSDQLLGRLAGIANYVE